MKPKARKSPKATKGSSKILKPSVSAASIRRTLKNVIQKELLDQPATTTRNRRTRNDQSKPAKDKPYSNQRQTKNKLQIPNDHEAAGSSREPVKPEAPKRQKTSLLEIPKLPSRQGTVFVIGENDVQQLGIQDETTRLRPTKLPLEVPIVDIVAGGMHSVCLSANGEVYTFGCNDEGALGRVDDSESLPEIVSLPEKIVMISAGDSHSAALSETGKVYLWGNFRNSQGAMGLTADGQKHATPLRILPDLQIVKIASGVEHLVCLSSDGDVYTCGCAESGQLGRIAPRSCADGGRTGGLGILLDPGIVRVPGKQRKFDDIWTGHYATFLREKRSNNIYAFGLNNYSQLGYRSKEITRHYPKIVSSFNDVRIISGGQHHTLLLDTSGCVYSFGRGDYGRLGLGENATEVEEPTLVPTLQSEECGNVSCGNCVSFAVSTSGSAYSWGMGDNGQLGHGSEDDCFMPTVIEGKLASWNVFRAAGGGQHTLLLADTR